METNISKEDLYLFQTGKAQKAYLMFGCHYLKEADAHEFVVWAPNAKSVSLVGDFNQWNPLSHPMKQTEPGIYSIQVEGLEKGIYINTTWKAWTANADIRVIHSHSIQR